MKHYFVLKHQTSVQPILIKFVINNHSEIVRFSLVLVVSYITIINSISKVPPD